MEKYEKIVPVRIKKGITFDLEIKSVLVVLDFRDWNIWVLFSAISIIKKKIKPKYTNIAENFKNPWLYLWPFVNKKNWMKNVTINENQSITFKPRKNCKTNSFSKICGSNM